MASATVRKGWNIPVYTENQPISGFISTACTYHFRLDNGMELIASICNVIINEEKKEVTLESNVQWSEEGPTHLTIPRAILLSDIVSAERVFIRYGRIPSPRNKESDFIFTFDTVHGPYNVDINSTDFVMISVREGENIHRHYGYIKNIITDIVDGESVNNIDLSEIINNRGSFAFVSKKIDLEDAIGVYRNEVIFDPYKAPTPIVDKEDF